MSRSDKKKKQKDNEPAPEALCEGLKLYTSPSLNKCSPVKDCIIKGIWAFLTVFGTLGGMLSALELKYDAPLTALLLFVSAEVLALLYASKKTHVREIAYLIIMLLFLLYGWQYRNYVNSGFYVVVNEFYEDAGVYFDLKQTVTYNIEVTNSYLCLTLSTFFIGFVSLILLNVAISEKMSGTAPFIYCVVITAFASYLRKEPGMIYMLMMILGISCPLLLRTTGHFRYHKNKKGQRIAGGDDYAVMKDRDGTVRVSYSQDGTVLSQLTLYALVFTAAAVLAFNVFYPLADNRFDKYDSGLKSKVDTYVKQSVQYGLSSYFNQYEGAGGMSRGRLGGIYAVRPDYQTDLIVTYAPQSEAAIYLKGWTGDEYQGDRWSENNDEDQFLQDQAASLKADFDSGNETSSMAKITIKNVGADIMGYVPYYTPLNSNYAPYIAYKSTATYTYYPYHKKAVCDAEYPSLNYLSVPAYDKTVIKKLITENDISGTQMQKIQKVIQLFATKYSYTVSPGTTPAGKDFCAYFLTDSKKGFCVHFATAATLMFRTMGMPARYVEGYVVTPDLITDGKAVSGQNINDWYRTDNKNATVQKTVVRVNVDDSKAHAWCEVWIDGFGWAVVDATPASTETQTQDTGFWASIRSLFGKSANSDINIGDNGTSGGGSKFSWGSLSTPAYILLFVIVLGASAYAVVSVIKINDAKRAPYAHEPDPQIKEYIKLSGHYRRKYPAFASLPDHAAQIAFMNAQKNAGIDVGKTASLIEKISFSKQVPSSEDRKYLRDVFRKLR